MELVGFTYELTSKYKNGKPKVEHVTSWSKRPVSFFKRNGTKVHATLVGKVYKPVAPKKKRVSK